MASLADQSKKQSMLNEEYDVRAVEARLADMEARRRLRFEHTRPKQRPQPDIHVVSQAMNIGDFDLSTCDSSASESESEDEEEERENRAIYKSKSGAVGRASKDRLRDSLDLSMSMAVDPMPVCGNVQPTHPAVKSTSATSHSQQASSSTRGDESNIAQANVASQPGVGRLVQRRRELEREAAQQIRPTNARTNHQPATVMEEVTLVAVSRLPKSAKISTVARGHATPSSQVKPVNVEGTSRLGHEENKPKSATVLLSTPSSVSDASGVHNTSINPVPALAPSIPTGSSASRVARHLDAPTTMASAPVVAAPTPLPVSQPFMRTTQPRTAIPLPTNQPATHTIPVPTTAATVKQNGYARGHSQTVPPAPNTMAPVKSEPQDDATDLIDDLLTAEELRLRESLEKLTSRLSSLSSARTASTYTPSPPNNHHESVPIVSSDDSKSLRQASYGGGTHTRPHQQTSPSSRASLAKRTELSSGVPKARVRPGATTVVQDPVTMSEGKHKVVIKRDLAHLLF